MKIDINKIAQEATEAQNEGRLEDAIESYKKLLEYVPKFAEAHSNLGTLLYQIGKADEAVASYSKAIELNPEKAEIHYNFGNLLKNLGKLDKAELSFKKALEIKPDFKDARCNLGNVYKNLEKNQEAIIEYIQVLHLDPNYHIARNNLISVLNYFLPSNINHPIIVANKNLTEIKNNFSLENGIKKFDLANFFEKSNLIIKDNITDLKYDKTQIYRSNAKRLGCERHMKIFNKFKFIPKFCFSCFKIQIEPNNVLELFKLFFIFDKLKIPGENVRKCMVELRPKVPGTYKGLIYCESMEEANKILTIIQPIIVKLVECKIRIKRGCSEYVDIFPNYKITNKDNIKFMKYNNEWLEKEKKFDDINIQNYTKKKSVMNGLSISDILIMNNWLNYAKEINDLSYKDISEEMFCSDIPKMMSKQIEIRKKEFHAKALTT